jgi:hypothetical protein
MCAQFVEELSGDGISCCWPVEGENADTARIGSGKVCEINAWSRLGGIEAESRFEEVGGAFGGDWSQERHCGCGLSCGGQARLDIKAD